MITLPTQPLDLLPLLALDEIKIDWSLGLRLCSCSNVWVCRSVLQVELSLYDDTQHETFMSVLVCLLFLMMNAHLCLFMFICVSIMGWSPLPSELVSLSESFLEVWAGGLYEVYTHRHSHTQTYRGDCEEAARPTLRLTERLASLTGWLITLPPQHCGN